MDAVHKNEYIGKGGPRQDEGNGRKDWVKVEVDTFDKQ